MDALNSRFVSSYPEQMTIVESIPHQCPHLPALSEFLAKYPTFPDVQCAEAETDEFGPFLSREAR